MSLTEILRITRCIIKSWNVPRRTFLIRVFIMTSTMLFIPSTDRVKPSTSTPLTPPTSNSNKWRILILVKCSWSTAEPWLPEAPVKSCFSNKLWTKMMKLSKNGSSITFLTGEDSFSLLKEIRGFRLRLMTRFTFIWLTQKPSNQLLRT